MDEIVAMRQAGIPDQMVIDRLRATGQVFELTPDQQAYLRTNGVDQYVIDQIPQINRQVRDELLGQPAAPAPTGAPGYQQNPSQPAYSQPAPVLPPVYQQPPPAVNPSLNTPVPPPPN